MVSLTEFGNKYPFLKANLPFWEKYYTARKELEQLLPSVIDTEILNNSKFFLDLDNNKSFLELNDIKISSEDGRKLMRLFSSAMDLKVRSYNFPEKLTPARELQLKENTTSFVLAEVHSAVCHYISKQLSPKEPANWLETHCPICGELAGLGIINEKGKKVLVCNHCHAEWFYSRSKCGLCGHQHNEKGTVIVTSEDFKGWIEELCDECRQSLKVYDMRKGNPELEHYPLYSLSSWGFDIAMLKRDYEPAYFAVFERAGWL